MNKQSRLEAVKNAQEIKRDGIRLIVFQYKDQRGIRLFSLDTLGMLFVGRGVNVQQAVASSVDAIRRKRLTPYTGPYADKMAHIMKQLTPTK